MPSKIAQRIERELGVTGLVDALAHRLPASDLRSLLMEVYRTRTEGVKESGLREQFARDPLMAPSAAGARELLALDAIAFQAAADFTALDLSPVCPFAASSILGGTSQNNILTAVRNAEVLGDSTIAMALEAARRRASGEVVRLCASQRVVRLQPFDVAGFSPHFRLFAMVTAGRDTGSLHFETDHLLEHVRVYLQMFRLLNTAGFTIQCPLVEFTDIEAVERALGAAGVTAEEIRAAIRAHWLGGSHRFLAGRGIKLPGDARHPLLEEKVIAPLRAEFPEAGFRVNAQRLEGLGYYHSFALRISPQALDGARYPVVDGGFTAWTARLLGNRKERLLVSGAGSEFLCNVYRPGVAVNRRSSG